MGDQYRDTKGQSDRTDISESYFEKLRVRGEGPPYIKVGRAVRYRDSDVDAWLAARIINSTSETPAASSRVTGSTSETSQAAA